MTTEENPLNAISKKALIKEVLEISKKIDNVAGDEKNIRDRYDGLDLDPAFFGIKKLGEQKSAPYQFDVRKKEVIKYLLLPESSTIFDEFDIRRGSFRKLKNKWHMESIPPNQKQHIVESFKYFIQQGKELGLSEEVAQSNIDFFWKFIREKDEGSLQTKVDFENNFFYPYDLFKEIMDYRSAIFETAQDTSQTGDEFQDFIDRFTDLELALLNFCKDFLIRKMQYEATNLGFYPYDLDQYFSGIYDDEDYQHQALTDEEVFSILTEILTNGR